MDYYKESLRLHYEWKGKLETKARAKASNREELSLAYTPGVAEGNWSYRVTKEQLLGADCGFFRSLNNIYKR